MNPLKFAKGMGWGSCHSTKSADCCSAFREWDDAATLCSRLPSECVLRVLTQRRDLTSCPFQNVRVWLKFEEVAKI